MSAIVQQYLARTPRSRELGLRAEQVMPGGDTRAAGFHLPYPLTLASGQGPMVRDVDGNEYLDLSYNYTSLVHGHAYPPIVEAATRQIGRGTAWPARAESQTQLAELLVERVASVDKVRFTNSGTEASILAMHVAKVTTGRPKILMARQGYHGSHEATESGTYAGLTDAPVFGGPTGEGGSTLVADFGDAATFEKVLAERGEEVAAVFLEPVMGAGGIATAGPDFFQRVAAAARSAGALLVLDEVITFRLGTGGAQGDLGVVPDLTMFGKLIGGGFPVGALGGRDDLMAVTDPRGRSLVHSGTFNGNPVTTTAGAVAVRELTEARIGRMSDLAGRLADGVTSAATAAGLPVSIRRAGSLLNVFLSPQPPVSAFRRDDQTLIERLHLAGMNHGLYFASRGLLVLSTVLTEELVDDAIERFGRAMADAAADAAEG